MKRFLCAVILTACLLVLAACGSAKKTEAAPTASPAATSSRNTSPVKVNETVANAQNVETAAQQSAEPSSTAAPIDTPATGDYPIVYLAGVLGLILVCSAGLLMLRKI